MKLLGIDYGTAKVGLAMGDSESGLATPLEIMKNDGDKQLCQEISELVKKESIEKIVVGLPFNPEGRSDEQIKKTEAFIERLKEMVDIELAYEDERFTTRQAQGLNNSGDEDDLAAMLILQVYLDKQKN
jgi:putative holliday junction resolvase